RADGSDFVIFHQIIQHIGGDERRQRRPQKDVFDTQVQKRQQDADCFLFIPGQYHGKRQVVDSAAESVGKSHGHLDGAVGVVALSHVHDTGKSADGSRIQIVEAVFSAGQGEDDAVVRRLFYEFCIVVSSGPCAVAA